MIELAGPCLALVVRLSVTAQVTSVHRVRDTSCIGAISRMLLPRLLNRISTTSSATSVGPSAGEHPTLGWVSF